MKKLVKLPTVRYKKIKGGDLGYWIGPKGDLLDKPGAITIDVRLQGKLLLEVLIHELLHEYFRDVTEEKVESTARRMAQILHDHNIRETRI